MGCNISANTIVAVEEAREPESRSSRQRSTHARHGRPVLLEPLQLREPEGRGRRQEPTAAHAAERRPSPGLAAQAPASGHARRGSKSSLASSQPDPAAREDFDVRVQRGLGDVLGAGLGNTNKGAVIFNVQENGLLDVWNRANPDKPLYPGLIITEVNGVSGYFPILEELKRPGELAMRITATPPRRARPTWFEEIAAMGRNLEMQGGKNTFMLRLQPQDPNATSQSFSSLPNVRAGDVGVEQCAICLEDVEEDDTLVQLPCMHGFHAMCAARWLTQTGRHGSGKRQCCPLCCRKVVSTPDGGISAVEGAAQN